MSTASSMRRIAAWSVALASGLVAPLPLLAQSTDAYLATAIEDHVVVRSGADARYYFFGEVHTGDIVKVLGEKSGWARVATEGPAFEGFFGYVRYPKAETGQIHVDEAGASAVTIGTVDVFAPNLDSQGEPGSSWKPVISLPPQRVLRIIETSFSADGQCIHRVGLPPDAQGWIDVAMLRPATPVEIATWEAAIAVVPAEEVGPPVPAQLTRAPDVEPVADTAQPALGRLTPNAGAAIEEPKPAPPAPAVTPAPPPMDPAAQKRLAETRLARIMLEDLEAAYARLLAEPIETAEVLPLQQLYLDLAGRQPGSRSITRHAQGRAKQLQLWADAQESKIEIAELRAAALRTAEDAGSARQVIDAGESYAVVGRLEASTLYDGARLPKLLRLSDPATGRTIGYIQPTPENDYATILGRRVGVVGKSEYHGGFRVHLISPRRIDVLEP